MRRPLKKGESVTIVAHNVGGIGGMELQLEALITRLLERGLDVDVVSRTLRLPPHAHLRWRRVPGPARPFSFGYPWFALAASLMLVRRRAGVLHTTGAIVFNHADVCTVHYLHSGRNALPPRTQYSTPLYRLNAVAAGVMSRLFERLTYSSTTRVRALVAVSKRLETELITQFPKRGRSIRMIRNGVDTQRFRPDSGARTEIREALSLDDSAALALFVGSEWQRKGVDIAVDSLVAAPSWHLAVVGRGDKEALKRRAESLGVTPRLHLAGESRKPERYYAAADAFVLPSAYEAASLAVFEAAACGLPVIATHVGASEEIVTAGGGILVERNAMSLASALRHLEECPDEAHAMAKRARETALSFDWDAVADAYVALYRESHAFPRPPDITSAAP